jgi:hypothetical protein
VNEELEKLVLRRIVEERNHQGKDNLLLFPSAEPSSPSEGNAIKCKQRLGGMLKYCYREAA